VWKNQDFSIFQILREINFGESRSFKTAVFCNLGDSEYCYFGNFQPPKSAIIQTQKNQNSEPLNVLKCADFAVQN